MRRVRSVVLPFLKTSTAAITLGTGNSLGPEGPSVEIGRTMAKGLGSFLRSCPTSLPTLMPLLCICGQLRGS